MDASVGHLQEERDTLRDQLEDLKYAAQQLDELKDTVATLTDDNQRLQKQNNSYEYTNSQLSKQVDELTSTVESLHKDLQQDKIHIDQLRQDISQRDGSIATLREQVQQQQSLLQQRELLRCDHHFGMTHRTLEVQYGVSYVCRSVRPLSMVVDVDTGVLLTSLLELLDATRLRAVVNSLAGETVRYDRLIVVIETHDTDTKEITTPLQCLLAGIMFFPVETMIHFSSHRIPSSYIGPALQTRQAASGSASTLCTAVRPRGEWTLSPFSTVGLLLPAGLLDGRRNGTAAVVLHHPLREPVRVLLHQLSRWKCWRE